MESTRATSPGGCHYFNQCTYDEVRNCNGLVCTIVGCACYTFDVPYSVGCYMRSSSDGGREVWVTDLEESHLFAQGFVRCDEALARAVFNAHPCADGG